MSTESIEHHVYSRCRSTPQGEVLLKVFQDLTFNSAPYDFEPEKRDDDGSYNIFCHQADLTRLIKCEEYPRSLFASQLSAYLITLENSIGLQVGLTLPQPVITQVEDSILRQTLYYAEAGDEIWKPDISLYQPHDFNLSDNFSPYSDKANLGIRVLSPHVLSPDEPLSIEEMSIFSSVHLTILCEGFKKIGRFVKD